MKNKLFIYLFILAILAFASCNKSKQNAKTLQGTTWKITSINIDGVSDTLLPTLDFGNGNIYKEILIGKWHNGGIKQSFVAIDISFAWQFRDKGKIFEISNQTEGDDALQCSQLSGIYNVVSASKTQYKLSSNTTVGFNKQQVIITMQKQ